MDDIVRRIRTGNGKLIDGDQVERFEHLISSVMLALVAVIQRVQVLERKRLFHATDVASLDPRDKPEDDGVEFCLSRTVSGALCQLSERRSNPTIFFHAPLSPLHNHGTLTRRDGHCHDPGDDTGKANQGSTADTLPQKDDTDRHADGDAQIGLRRRAH